MAKNILDQILSLTGIKLPDANGHYDPSVYRNEPSPEKNPSELTGVEKHLQKRNATMAGSTSEATGVAKYLAQKQQQNQKKSESSDLTGVAKYLAQKQQKEQEKAKAEATALANMTGVARYLAKLESDKKITPSKTAAVKKENTATLTGVDKYLAKQKTTPPVIQQPKVLEETPEKPMPTPEANVLEKQPVVEKKKETQEEKTIEPEPADTTIAKATNKLINVAANASQCQAATLKGTRCRRKTNLDVIEKTINKQKYKFAVCSQHVNSDFIPFSEFLQKD